MVNQRMFLLLGSSGRALQAPGSRVQAPLENPLFPDTKSDIFSTNFLLPFTIQPLKSTIRNGPLTAGPFFFGYAPLQCFPFDPAAFVILARSPSTSRHYGVPIPAQDLFKVLRPPLMVRLSNHRQPSFDRLRTRGWLISTTLKRPYPGRAAQVIPAFLCYHNRR